VRFGEVGLRGLLYRCGIVEFGWDWKDCGRVVRRCDSRSVGLQIRLVGCRAVVSFTPYHSSTSVRVIIRSIMLIKAALDDK
jgi:hypothetical protein